jgi:thiamine pyrophosphate-dependent acetolactate synthase large subunit-like protein
MDQELHTTGTAIIAALAANGVTDVFGIPGTHNLELYRGLARQAAITHVVTRHEQGAAYAADGYARASGRPGVVITTSGPGLTNALTGMANAYADSVPMLVISPGIPAGLERQDIGWLHEVKDQRAAVDNLVTRSVRPATPQQAVDAIHETFARWAAERPRPVHVEIPYDVLEQPWDEPAGPRWPAPHRAAPAPAALAEVVRLLGRTGGVVIIAGGGSVDAAAAITKLAERIDAPVLTTTLGKGVIDESHPLAVGEFAASPAASALINGADLVLAFGTELGGFAGHDFRGTLVRVDIDPAQLHKNVRAGIAIHADVRAAATALLASVVDPPIQRGAAAAAAAARAACLEQIEPRAGKWRPVQEVLGKVLPADVIVAGDSSQVSYLGTGPYWRFAGPRSYLVTTGYSTLGYAVPAAIGAKVADPARPVIALLGDGALMFSVQELLTAAELRLALPVIVIDNHGFGEIRDNMVERSIPPMAVDLRCPDFVLLAQSLGCLGVRVDSLGALAAQAAAALEAPCPTLIIIEAGPEGLPA